MPRPSTNHQGKRANQPFITARFKAKNLPRFDCQRCIPCPECHAEVGEGCVSNTGKAMSNNHIARQRLALRKHREEEANEVPEL
jgi:hypothetical protein